MNELRQPMSELESLAPDAPTIRTHQSRADHAGLVGRSSRFARAALVVAVAGGAIVLTSCTSSPPAESSEVGATSNDSAPTTKPSTLDNAEEKQNAPADPDCSRTGIGIEMSEYVGLSELEAWTKAEESGLFPNVECRDGVHLVEAYLTDLNATRLWLRIQDGQVTHAHTG